jgi:hypothetical protein
MKDDACLRGGGYCTAVPRRVTRLGRWRVVRTRLGTVQPGSGVIGGALALAGSVDVSLAGWLAASIDDWDWDCGCKGNGPKNIS